MGRHHYAKDVKVTVTQGQRKTYYDHDNPTNREGPLPQRGNTRGANRVWRRGDRRVSFNDKRGGGISKQSRGGPRGGDRNRPKFNIRADAILEQDESMRAGPSIRRGGRGRGRVFDRNRFTHFAKKDPLSEENKKLIQEAMHTRFIQETKALNLESFGRDPKFGGSSEATGNLSDDRVVEVVLNTIKEFLSDLKALSLKDNNLRSLRAFAKLAESAPQIEILYLEKNRLAHTKELDYVSQLKLIEMNLDGNSFVANFKDGSQYKNIMQRKFKTLQKLDGTILEKLITFEDDESTTRGPSSINIPMQPKMVVNDQCGDFIGKFLEQYFKVYDSDNRENLAMAYHEEAMMSMSASFGNQQDRLVTTLYIPESRNLQVIQDRNKRDRLIHLKRLQIVGFLDKLPKTQHDLTSFTLDIPFATEHLLTFTVTGVYRERMGTGQTPPIKQFCRMFVAIPQGEGLCIVNDTLYVTHATREQSERTKTLFEMADKTKMNLEWSKQCLDAQNWNFQQAFVAFEQANREGKIPAEAFIV